MPHVNVYSMDEPKELIIDGLVENPMKISYNELKDFPQVWEVVELWCVEGYKVVKYNWTGVPLIYLLSKAKFKDGAKEVIFYASDGFTSSITLGEALEPTSILALEANGTNLSEVKERGGGYRIILPCRWGYKWVSNVERIEVIDYDYKGLWESLGYPDEGKMSICPEMLVSDAIFNLNIEVYKINVSGFTAGKIDKMNFNYKDGVLKIDLGFSSNFETFLNLFIEEGKGYSGIDLLLDGRKGNLTLLGNENVKAILLEGIEGEHTITILAYESEIRENGKVSNTIIYLIILVAIAMVIIYLIFVFEYRIKKNFKI
jgi:hypothetical protein